MVEISVIYEGKRINMKQLAAILGVSQATVAKWWRRAGSPKEIDQTLAERIAARKLVRGLEPSLTVRYRGAEITLVCLAKAHNIETSLLYRRWRESGRPADIPDRFFLPRGERSKSNSAFPADSPEQAARKAAKLAAIPGPSAWEREHLAQAGRRGCSLSRAGE